VSWASVVYSDPSMSPSVCGIACKSLCVYACVRACLVSMSVYHTHFLTGSFFFAFFILECEKAAVKVEYLFGVNVFN